MKIAIDEHSGCCNGVRRAIEQAERCLHNGERLYCLGAIVHNDVEISRLAAMGMKTVAATEFAALRDSTVLIRAHGEPPATYQTAADHNLTLIDCTCPVVLKIQREISATYRGLKSSSGQIVIFGKKGHAEVNGLVGQAEGNAIVVERISDVNELMAAGKIKRELHIEVFSQTTMDSGEYSEICRALACECRSVSVHNTICSQVSSRHPNLEKFAAENDVVIFVSGKKSSNGRILFELCHDINTSSYMVENPQEIEKEWFVGKETVGICGATSTPRRQLEECARFISRSFIGGESLA